MSSPALASPRRFIYNDQDMEQFLQSPCKRDLMTFTSAMGKSCSTAAFEYNPAHPLSGLSPAMAALHGSLRQMLTWIDDIPPLDNAKARFGNPAFKAWHARLVERSVSVACCALKIGRDFCERPFERFEEAILEDASRQGFQAAASVVALESLADDIEQQALVQELSAYLQLSFGHPIRLDYGTGHESCFQVFLFALCKLGCFGSNNETPPTPERLKATTISIYSAYLLVCRQIQTEYMLEPAGSHGVWGLDDYHCLPFYFGACQLQAVDADLEITPKSVHNDKLLQQEGDTFLYLGCIRYIKRLKKGAPFFESSPMLNDISGLPTWSKVAAGLLSLYEGEVLKKRQVVQHFLFGNIFAANWIPSEEQEKQAPRETFRASTSSTQALSRDANSAHLSTDFSPTRAPWAK